MPDGNIAFKFNLKAAKEGFFDRDRVKKSLDELTYNKLNYFGNYVKRVAHNSIKTSKSTSKPGQPPRSHVGTLKNLIFAGYDTTRHSTVIGPTLSNKRTGAPHTLEYGGTINVEGHAVYRKVTGTRGPRGGRRRGTVYIKEVLHGTRRIEPRPYMHPAFEKGLVKFMDKWKDQMR